MNVTRQLECIRMNCSYQLRSQMLKSRIIPVQSKSSVTTRSGISHTSLRNVCQWRALFQTIISKTAIYRQQKFVSNSISQVPFKMNRNVSKDTLVFSNENESTYKVLTFFGILQMVMWGYLSLSPVQGLRSGPVLPAEEISNLPWWKRWLYKEGRYKNAITGICLTVGTSVLFVTLTYPQRAIRSLWLLKGGKNIKITTYSYFKKSQSFSTPVEHVNCLQSRTGGGSQIPLKIKDTSFFFLMDKQGVFHNPEMFDFVIGLKRNF